MFRPLCHHSKRGQLASHMIGSWGGANWHEQFWELAKEITWHGCDQVTAPNSYPSPSLGCPTNATAMENLRMRMGSHHVTAPSQWSYCWFGWCAPYDGGDELLWRHYRVTSVLRSPWVDNPALFLLTNLLFPMIIIIIIIDLFKVGV